MKTITYSIKNVFLSLFAALSLFVQAYIGAVLFISCVLLEKYLIITESRYTVDSLLEEVSLIYKGKVDHYKHVYENLREYRL